MHKYFNKFMKSKSKRKIIIFALILLVLVSSVSAFTSASAKLDSEEIELGLSSENLAIIEEEGSLENGDLKLILGLSETVEQVKMIDPNGEIEEKEAELVESKDSETNEAENNEAENSEALAEKDSIGSLSQFSELLDDDINLEKASDKVIIGESSGEVQLGSSGEETTKQVVFDAPVTGVYTFELFDAEGTFLKRQTYIVGTGLFPDALTIKLIGGAPINYRVGRTEALVDYTPKLTGEKEVLTVTLPPFFYFTSSLPSGGADYTVEKKTVPIPPEFYSDADSSILMGMPAGQTNCEAYVFTFSENAANPISVSFEFTGVNSTGHGNLGLAMVAYGANPDIIPLRLTAKGASLDGSKLVSAQSVNTTSKMPDATGDNTGGPNEALPSVKALPGHVPSANWKFNFSHLIPGTTAGGGTSSTTGGNALAAGQWHYPVVDIKFYTPLFDVGVANQSADNGTTTIGGKSYRVSNSGSYTRPADLFNKNNLYYFRPELPQTSLKAGMTYTVGDMYMSYMYRGVEYGPVVVATAEQAVLPAYSTTIAMGNAPLSNFPNLTTLKRLQDSPDKLRFAFNNNYPALINPLHEDLGSVYSRSVV